MNDLPDVSITEEDYRNICAWCCKHVSKDQQVFALLGKHAPGYDYSNLAGKYININLSSSDKSIVAFFTPDESESKLDGIVILTCSKSCAVSLRKAVEIEKEILFYIERISRHTLNW